MKVGSTFIDFALGRGTGAAIGCTRKRARAAL
jgi:hypothetical protein